MGFGSIVIFALIGVQIVLAVVGFYVVSLLSLLLIPFGAFVGTQGFLSRSLQGVLKAGVRVFVVIFIIGVAATVWKAFPEDAITLTTKFDQPLSLFLSALIVLALLWKLPEVAVDLVGDIKGNIWGDTSSTTVSIDAQSSSSPSASLHSVASGTYLPPYGSSDRAVSDAASLSPQGGNGSSGGQQAAFASSVQLTAGGSGLFSEGNSKTMKRSSEINEGPRRR
jgi:type IV secretory pathway TrbL component